MIISLAGIVWGTDAVKGKIYGQLNGLVGSAAASQIQDIIRIIKESRLGASGAVVGVIVLVVGVTGVFAEIQDSINYIWSIRAKPKRGWLQLVINRLLSFSLIVSFGFILLVSLIVNAVVELLHDRLQNFFDEATVYIFHTLNYVILLAIITTLFAIIFKVLPDAIIRWRDAWVGAIFTTFLFLVGKFLIGFYLSRSNIGLTYGTAASIVLLLLWVYYTSIILYFGAEFTKVYTIEKGGGIMPAKHAVFIVKQETRESPKRSRQKADLPTRTQETTVHQNINKLSDNANAAM